MGFSDHSIIILLSSNTILVFLSHETSYEQVRTVQYNDITILK